jgi:hypothetical protein
MTEVLKLLRDCELELESHAEGGVQALDERWCRMRPVDPETGEFLYGSPYEDRKELAEAALSGATRLDQLARKIDPSSNST